MWYIVCGPGANNTLWPCIVYTHFQLLQMHNHTCTDKQLVGVVNFSWVLCMVCVGVAPPVNLLCVSASVNRLHIVNYEKSSLDAF